MIKVSQENLVVVENKKGDLVVEQDAKNCVSMTLHVQGIALRMVGLYDKQEMMGILSEKEYFRMKNKMQQLSIGQKKVLETICFQPEETGKRGITFISEDTTYEYELQMEEWQEITSLISFVTEQD